MTPMVYPHVTEISRADTGALALPPTERALAALTLRLNTAGRFRLAPSADAADHARVAHLNHRTDTPTHGKHGKGMR